MLDERAIELLKAPNFAAVTTLLPDGRPQTHPVWVDSDGEHVLINTESHRQKTLNVKRDSRATVLVWNRDDMWNWAEIRGDVVEIVGGTRARNHIDELSNKYLGHDYRNPVQTERVVLKIAPRRQIIH